jgi:hypothetical protein
LARLDEDRRLDKVGQGRGKDWRSEVKRDMVFWIKYKRIMSLL